MDLGDLSFEALGSAGDEARRRPIERIDLVEHALLMCDRHGHRDGHLQCVDGHVGSAIDATDKLPIVTDDGCRGEHTLLIDCQLLLEIHRSLTPGEDDQLLDERAV